MDNKCEVLVNSCKKDTLSVSTYWFQETDWADVRLSAGHKPEETGEHEKNVPKAELMRGSAELNLFQFLADYPIWTCHNDQVLSSALPFQYDSSERFPRAHKPIWQSQKTQDTSGQAFQCKHPSTHGHFLIFHSPLKLTKFKAIEMIFRL